MKKNTKILIMSAIGLGVLVLVTVVLLLVSSMDSADNSSTSDSNSSTTSTVDESLILANQKADNISTLTVKNAKDEYTIKRLGVDKWEITQLGEAPITDGAYSTSITAAAAITAKKLVEENVSDMAKYGLDKPQAEFTIVYKDDTAKTVTFIVGAEAPSESAYYFAEKDSKNVYIVATSALSFALNTKYSYISTTLTPAYDTEKAPVIDRIRIHRKDLDKDIVLDVIPEDPNADEDTIATTYATYMFSSHNDVLADDEDIQYWIYGLYGLTATEALKANLSDEDKKEAGLDDPTAVISMVVGDKLTKLTIGNPIYATTTDKTTGEETKAISGYMCVLEGIDVLYNIPVANLSWLTAKVDNAMYRIFLSPYIYYLNGVNVKTADGEYKFTVTGDADESSFALNGEKIDSAKFKSFYQYLISAAAEELYLEDIKDTDTFVATITYDYKDKEKTDDVVSLYISSDRKCIITVNGATRYKCRQIYATRFLENIATITSGGDINQNW